MAQRKLGAFASLTAVFGTALILWCVAPEPYVDHHEEMLPPGAVAASQPRSPRWRSFRARVLRENPACAACGTLEDIDLHHIVSFHEAPHLELVESNVVPLCRRHHFQIGHYCGNGKSNWGLCSNPRAREDAAAERRRRSQ